MQVTPPPPPPLLVTPQPSPSATPSASPSVSPASSPSASPAPPMTIAGAPVNLHPGESKTLTIQNGTGPSTTSVDTPLVTATVDQNARTLTVTASQQTG